MKRRLTLTKVDVIAIAGLLGVSAAAHFFGFVPVRAARAAAMGENALLSTRSEELAERERSVEAAKARVRELDERIAAAIPLQTPDKLNQRMAAIPELGAAVGVRVREVVPKSPQTGKRLVRVPITIGGDAPTTILTTFLHELHSRFPDMEVLTLNLAARPESPQEPARFTMDLVWYTRADSDVSKGAPPEKPPPTP